MSGTAARDAETLVFLWAAREAGIVDAYLERAGTPAEAAAIADVTEESARVAGRVLHRVGVLDRVDGEYEPANRALGLLTTRDPRSIGSLPHRLDRIDALVGLPETMATGVAPQQPTDAAVKELGAREATGEATVRACVTAAVRANPDAETVLELCGGAGTYAAEFVARGREATVLEAADVLDRVELLLSSRGVDGRSGPLDEVGDGFDLVAWIDAPTGMDADEAATTVDAAAEVVADDGAFVLIDAFSTAGNAGDGEPNAAATRADVRGLATGHGGAHPVATVREWLTDAGLDAVTDEPVPGTDFHAVIGRFDDHA